jgi:hypothetical protein
MEHLSATSNEEVWNVQGKADNKCSRNRLLCLFYEMGKNILLMSMILMAEPPIYLSIMRSLRTRKFLLPHGIRVCVLPIHLNVWINRHLAENLRQRRIFLAALWRRKVITIPFFWDKILCQYVIGSRLFEQSWSHYLQGSRLRSLETPKTHYTVT